MLLPALGCGVSPPTLDEAVSQIPVYANSTLEESMGLTEGTLEAQGIVATHSVHFWVLTTSDAMEKVVAFYDARLAKAKRVSRMAGEPWPDDFRSQSPDDEAGAVAEDTVTYSYRPKGFAEDESVEIVVTPGGIQITETVQEQRRP
jgi:hypothetical protein